MSEWARVQAEIRERQVNAARERLRAVLEDLDIAEDLELLPEEERREWARLVVGLLLRGEPDQERQAEPERWPWERGELAGPDERRE